jgi:hypothetical protein
MNRDPIERSLEIEQAQLRGFARSLSEVEWLLLILVRARSKSARPDRSRLPGRDRPFGDGARRTPLQSEGGGPTGTQRG